MEEHNPPSTDPRTAPFACCIVPSNFPTIRGVQNSNEIPTAAELAITCALGGLCCSLYYNQVTENKVCADGESELSAHIRPETELQLLCLEKLDPTSWSRQALLHGEAARLL